MIEVLSIFIRLFAPFVVWWWNQTHTFLLLVDSLGAFGWKCLSGGVFKVFSRMSVRISFARGSAPERFEVVENSGHSFVVA